jgi:ribosomal protein S28E/S33
MGLYPICLPFAKAKRYALVFEMGNRLQPLMPPTDGAFWINSIHTYHFLKADKGPQEAMRWLDRQTQGPTRVNLLLEAFGLGEYEVLWSYPAKLDKDAETAFWMLKAVASSRVGIGNDPHRKELEAHFARAWNSHYDTLGRYIMGTVREGDVLALADTKPHRSEVCFYLASRAASEGRMKDAMAWYRLCMEMGDTNSMEYTWAGETLDRWKSKETCLSNLVTSSQDLNIYFDWTAEDAPF